MQRLEGAFQRLHWGKLSGKRDIRSEDDRSVVIPGQVWERCFSQWCDSELAATAKSQLLRRAGSLFIALESFGINRESTMQGGMHLTNTKGI